VLIRATSPPFVSATAIGNRGRLDRYTIHPDGSGARRVTHLPCAAQPDCGPAP
jgi:hypothetical protein